MNAATRATWTRHAGSTRAANHVLDDLRARYAEPHRRYHDNAHLDRVVADCVRLLDEVLTSDPSAVVLAAFFHDAIYEPRSVHNEAASAALAVATLGELGIGPQRTATVERLVLATATHVPTDLASAVLLDADLAVLAAKPATYGAYIVGVRAEHAHVEETEWRVGRAAVLRGFLNHERIYHTPAFAGYEARARANLEAELQTLQ